MNMDNLSHLELTSYDHSGRLSYTQVYLPGHEEKAEYDAQYMVDFGGCYKTILKEVMVSGITKVRLEVQKI